MFSAQVLLWLCSDFVQVLYNMWALLYLQGFNSFIQWIQGRPWTHFVPWQNHKRWHFFRWCSSKIIDAVHNDNLFWTLHVYAALSNLDPKFKITEKFLELFLNYESYIFLSRMWVVWVSACRIFFFSLFPVFFGCRSTFVDLNPSWSTTPVRDSLTAGPHPPHSTH